MRSLLRFGIGLRDTLVGIVAAASFALSCVRAMSACAVCCWRWFRSAGKGKGREKRREEDIKERDVRDRESRGWRV